MVDNSQANNNISGRVIRGNPNSNSFVNRFQQSLLGSSSSSSLSRRYLRYFPANTTNTASTNTTTSNTSSSTTNTSNTTSTNTSSSTTNTSNTTSTDTPTVPTTKAELLRALDTNPAGPDGVVDDFEALSGILAGKVTENNIGFLGELNSKALKLRELVNVVNADGGIAISDAEVGVALTALKDTNSVLSRLQANAALGADPASRKALVDYVLGKNPSMGAMALSPDKRALGNQGVIAALLNGVTNSTPLLAALNSRLDKLRAIIGAIDTNGDMTITDAETTNALNELKRSGSLLSNLAADQDWGVAPPNTVASTLVNYVLYRNPTLDRIDSSNDNRVVDQEVIDALLNKTIAAGALLSAITEKSANLVSLVDAIDLNDDGSIATDEVLTALAELNRLGSPLSVLKDNTAIGQALIDYVLNKNASGILPAYKDVDRDHDGVISNLEVFNKLTALTFTSTTVVPEPLNSILATNPNYAKIKNLVVANNFNTLNHSNDGEIEVTDVVKLNNAKAVFIALLSAREAGLDALIRSKILDVNEGGYADVNKVYAMVQALDPDANGVVNASTYIQAYKSIKQIPGIPAYMSSIVSKLSVPGKTLYDFSDAKVILDRITLPNGNVNYTAIGTEILKIKKPPVPAGAPVNTALLTTVMKLLLAADIPSADTTNALIAVINRSTSNLNATQRADFTNRINNAQSLEEALAVVDDISDIVPITDPVDDLIFDLKTSLRDDFALITAISAVKLTPNMPLNEYVDLSAALLNTNVPLGSNNATAINLIRSSYTLTNPNPLSLATIDDVIRDVNVNFNGKIVDSSTIAALTSQYNRIIHNANGSINANNLIIASQALRSINPEALAAISGGSQNISDSEVFDQLLALNITSTTVIPEALRVILAANPHFSQIKTLLINNNFNTLNRVNSGTTVTDTVRLANAKAVFTALLEARKLGLDAATIKSKIPSSVGTGTGLTDVDKIYKLVQALDSNNDGIVNTDNYAQAYVQVKALPVVEPYLESLLTKFEISSTSNLYDFTATKAMLDRVTIPNGTIDYTPLGLEIKNIKASTASITDKNSSINTLKSLVLTSIPSATTTSSLETLLDTTSLTEAQKTSLVNSVKGSQTLAASLQLIDGISTTSDKTALKDSLRSDFALISAINAIQFTNAAMPYGEYIDLTLALQNTAVSAANGRALSQIKGMYNPNSTSPASPTSDEIIEVVGEIYTAFNGKLFTLDNIADAYNTYKTIIKNGGTTVDSDRVLVANETLRKINPNALSLITLKGILDPSGNGVVDDLELANALLTSRTSGFDAATKAKINDFLNKPENSSRATIIRNSVAKIDPDANGIVARSEFITNYVKYIEGKFTDAERPIVSALLQTSPKYSMLAPILNSLNLSPGADLGNNEVAAALLALRKKGTLSEQREIDTTLVALGVATRAANGVVTYDADVTKIRGAVDILAGYNGSYNNRFVPIAIDTNGEVTRNFLRYYLKEQALNWTSGDTNFPAAIKNTKVEEVTSILKSNFEYQRTKDLMTQFVSVSGTSRTFDYNSLVKILVKKNAISEPLTTDEYNYFKELIPTTAFKTANKTNALARQHEIDGLVKAISFIGTDRDLANIRTRFIASETANDISKIDFNGDSKTGTTDNVPSAPVPFTDRNLLNGVLSAMGLGPITW